VVRAFVTTLPKSGTHLINLVLAGLGLKRHFLAAPDLRTGLLSRNHETVSACVQRILDKVDQMPENAFVLDHVPYAPALANALAERDIRMVALLRNPFDVVVSLAHHLQKQPEPDTPRDLSMHALQHWICGGANPSTAKRNFALMHGWVGDERTLVLRFEEIVGPRGGGLFSDQLAAGLKLCDFLGVDMKAADMTAMLVRSFRPDIALFRRGQIGSWKEEMSPSTAEQVRLLYGGIFESWGYTPEGELIRHINGRSDMVEQMDTAVASLIEENVHLRIKAIRLAEEQLPE
jgi:hypothetical protein